MAVEVQQVEHVVDDRDRAARGTRRVDDADALLQAGEAGPPVLECDDLAVNHEIVGRLVCQCVGDLGIGAIESLARPGQQAQLRPLAKGEAALAVQLAPEQPPRVGEPPVGEGGEHRLDPRERSRRLQPAPQVR